MAHWALLALVALTSSPDAGPARESRLLRSGSEFLYARHQGTETEGQCGWVHLMRLPNESPELTFERDDGPPGAGIQAPVEYKLTSTSTSGALVFDHVTRNVRNVRGNAKEVRACLKPIHIEVSEKAVPTGGSNLVFTEQKNCEASGSVPLDLSACLSTLPPIPPLKETTRELRELAAHNASIYRLKPGCHCEHWQFSSGQEAESNLLVSREVTEPGVTSSQKYKIGADSIVLGGISTFRSTKGGGGLVSMSLCIGEEPVDLIEPGVFRVGDSTWFADRKACEAKQGEGNVREHRCTE